MEGTDIPPMPSATLAGVATEDLAGALADGFAHLRAAQGVQAGPAVAPARGADPDGLVEVVVDGHGLLVDVGFSPDIARLSPEQLEAAVLDAVRDAHRATGRSRVQSLPALGDSEVAARVRRVLTEEAL